MLVVIHIYYKRSKNVDKRPNSCQKILHRSQDHRKAVYNDGWGQTSRGRQKSYIQDGPKNEITLVRPIAATVQDKIKRISLKCFQRLRKYRLGYNFCAVVKYSLQISSVILLHGHNTSWASKNENFTFL